MVVGEDADVDNIFDDEDMEEIKEVEELNEDEFSRFSTKRR